MGRDWTKEHICKTGGYPCEACRVARHTANEAIPRPADLGKVCLRKGDEWRRFLDWGYCIFEEEIDTQKGPYPWAIREWPALAGFQEHWERLQANGWEVVPRYVYPDEKEGQK